MLTYEFEHIKNSKIVLYINDEEKERILKEDKQIEEQKFKNREKLIHSIEPIELNEERNTNILNEI